MACLPQMTGGRLFNAPDREQIGAAIEEALQLASSDAGRIEPPAAAQRRPSPSPGPSAATVPNRRPMRRPGSICAPCWRRKRSRSSLALNWTVTTEGEPGEVVCSRPGRQPARARGAGPLRDRGARRAGARPARPWSSATRARPSSKLVLNAGTLRVRAQAQKTRCAARRCRHHRQRGGAGQRGQEGCRRRSAARRHSRAARAWRCLPAGRYLVRVEQGLVRAERSVVVPAGSQGAIDVPLNAARLQLSAVGQEVAESADALIFSVAEDDPDAPSGRREVARSAARQAEFVLPPGTYYVIARLGSIEARETPGRRPRRRGEAHAVGCRGTAGPCDQAGGCGRRRRASRSPTASSASTAPPKMRSRPAAPSPVLLLLGGRYRVEGRYGVMNARVVREVEVKAGQTAAADAGAPGRQPEAASHRRRRCGRGGGVLGRQATRPARTVWTTGQAEPSATLQAGRYRIRAETREKRYDRAIELRSGEARVVELTAD